MQEIGWFYLNRVENGLDIDNIYDLLEEIDTGDELLMYTNIKSKNLEAGVFASGFYANEFYEESDVIEQALVDICNDLEDLQENEEKDLKIHLSDGTEAIIRIMHKLFFETM